MERDFYTTPKTNKLMRFLWKCAGADKYILERSTYTDHVKYACLGGIVLATGFMAAMAGGYAFYMIFEPRGEVITNTNESSIHFSTSVMSMIFGCIWGLIIFNIDRFIVASTGKGDGTEAVTWSEVKSAIPRILMGMIIAITISKPVEIRMFKTEIDVALHKKQLNKFKETQQEAIRLFQPKVDEIKSQIIAIKETIKEKQKSYDEAQVKFEGEMTARSGSGLEGYGPRAKKFEQEKDRILVELNELKEESKLEIAVLLEEQKKAVEKLDKEMALAQAQANSLDGLLERLKLAHQEAGLTISIFITLLFMAIELTPIFFKMMLIKSPYDFMDDNIKALLKAEQGIEVKYDFYKDKEGVQRNLVINHQAERLMKEKIKLLQTQNELSEIVMENWKSKEIQNIKSNPENYIDKKS